eukprot:GDKJ01048909.1.p1 GENE.GDKJ01048909.1~~GDKJ01048909.1.p1  ORF type:complete len:695 (-),score=173.48 GDKJ01048909.1:112-1887(-)
MDISFRGLPAPPLDLHLTLCLSCHRWLESDPKNVLVVHCFRGYTRSITFLSAFLVWMGESPSIDSAIKEIAHHFDMTSENILPSQHAALDRFVSVALKGTPAIAPPVKVERVLFHGIPRYETDVRDLAFDEGLLGTGGENVDVVQRCIANNIDPHKIQFRPIVEVWFDGKKVYSSVGKDVNDKNVSEVAGSCVADGSIVVDCKRLGGGCPLIRGDVLLRIRHLSDRNEVVTMMRAAFHSAFFNIEESRIRFSRVDLDGAERDPRVPIDFFMEVFLDSTPPSNETVEELMEDLEAQRKVLERTVDMGMLLRERKLETAEANEASASSLAPVSKENNSESKETTSKSQQQQQQNASLQGSVFGRRSIDENVSNFASSAWSTIANSAAAIVSHASPQTVAEPPVAPASPDTLSPELNSANHANLSEAKTQSSQPVSGPAAADIYDLDWDKFASAAASNTAVSAASKIDAETANTASQPVRSKNLLDDFEDEFLSSRPLSAPAPPPPPATSKVSHDTSPQSLLQPSEYIASRPVSTAQVINFNFDDDEDFEDLSSLTKNSNVSPSHNSRPSSTFKAPTNTATMNLLEEIDDLFKM